MQRVLRVPRLLVRSYRTGTRYLILLPTNTRGSTAVAQKVLSNSRSGKSDLALTPPSVLHFRTLYPPPFIFASIFLTTVKSSFDVDRMQPVRCYPPIEKYLVENRVT